jgi:hypothetical protein
LLISELLIFAWQGLESTTGKSTIQQFNNSTNPALLDWMAP